MKLDIAQILGEYLAILSKEVMHEDLIELKFFCVTFWDILSQNTH